ncbi:MAG: F0F1 ATP synthase subunit epsilon [Nitrospinota bacterium]
MEAEGTLHLEVVTPERKLVDRQVKFVSAPGIEGEFGVLAGHTEFFTVLGSGEISFEDETGVHFIAVSWGYAEIKPESVIILAENAELAEEIDRDRAERERDEWEAKLKGLAPDEEYYELYKSKYDRASTRVNVLNRTQDE